MKGTEPVEMLNGGEGLGWGEASRLFRNWRVPYAINKKKQTNKLVKELERNDFFLLKWQISMCVNVRVRACTYVYEWLEGISVERQSTKLRFRFVVVLPTSSTSSKSGSRRVKHFSQVF